ncbi:hypothetical protein VAEU17_4400135 [Vibrio aestuarianus]|nr:hypothetical protein VAEU17_4400135 [Vibrio aestuarianus]
MEKIVIDYDPLVTTEAYPEGIAL